MTNFRTFTCILGFVLFGALFIDSKCVHRHRHRKCWVECAADVKCKCHSVADKTTTDTTKTTTEPEQMTNRLSFRAVKAEMPREERLEQRLAMIPKKTAGDAPPPVQTPEELAKERELVTQMLEEYRAKRRPEVEALIKKQANDPNHQARLNAIKKAMLKHPEEARRLEKENGKSIPELNANRTDVYQGDMLLNLEQAKHLLRRTNTTKNATRQRRAVAQDLDVFPISMWPNAVVPYLIWFTDEAMESLIRIAISEYEKNTCLLFVEDVAQFFPQRISFVRIDSGCRCYVGRQNRGHTGCFLSADCDLAVVMHEIGHALGLLHEHSRWDREDWIRVDAEVVQEVLGDYDVQWWTDIDADSDETSYGLEYDTRSIMHYRSFYKDLRPAMIAQQGSEWQNSLGNDWLPTFYDYRFINWHYCRFLYGRTDRNEWANCQRGGYPHFDDTRRCICPAPAAGDNCLSTVMELPIIGPRGYAPEGVPNTCTGRTFWATDKWQNLEASIGATPWPASSGNDPRQAAYCHWLVRSTTGRKILTEVTKITGNGCANQCTRGFLSVRVNPDWGKPEIRLCCNSFSDIEVLDSLQIVSKDSHTVYSLYALDSRIGFELRFKMQ